MQQIKATITITIGSTEEIGLSLTQHIGDIKNETGKGSVGYALGSGEYRGSFLQKDGLHYAFKTDALAVLIKEFENFLNQQLTENKTF